MNRRILVIDDDIAVRKSFVLALEDTDYQVDTAETGEKGVMMKNEGKYDLIYLDLKMPGISGVEVLREIRKEDKLVPIYIVTAFHKDFFDDLKVAEAEGLTFQLVKKPLDSEKIVLISKSVLEGPISVDD